MPYIGNTVQNQGFAPAIDYFSGNGVTVTFTLSRPIASVAQVICAIDNVIQNPSSAFTVSGNSITFTSAPLAGTNNIWVEYTSLITTYAAISQDPSVIGDLTASGGFLSTGDFGNSYIDGVIVDYVTGAARLTTGPLDDMIFYHGGSSSRSEMMRLSYAGNSYVVGSLGINTTSPTEKLDVVGNADTTARLRASSDTSLILNETSPNKSWKFKSSDGTLCWQYSSTAYNSGYANTMNLTTAGALILKGGNTSATGVGIAFPATQSSSSDPNTLDDYEEGTWTPVVGGTATYSNQTGRYTKIGNLCFIQCDLVINSIGTGSTTTITGVPFTSFGSNEYTFPVDKSQNIPTAIVSMALRIAGTGIYAMWRTAASTSAAVNPSYMGNSTEVQFSGCYQVA